MFSSQRVFGNTQRRSPSFTHDDVSHIEYFRTLDAQVFKDVQNFFRQLGLPFQTDDSKREIIFKISPAGISYLQELQKRTWGIIAFDADGTVYTVDRVDAEKFKALSAQDFPAFTPFKSQLPSCRVTQHPAFIKDYSAAHTSIIQRQPAGTYAIMNEEDNHFLLAFVAGSSSRNVARGIKFDENPDGSIQVGKHHFSSIHEFLHDGKDIFTISPNSSYLYEKQTLQRSLTDVIANSHELQVEVAEYVKTRENPEILRIVAFLKNLCDLTSRFEENQLISAAIRELYLKPARASDILESLTRTLPDAACGIIDAPYVTTLGASDANYYRDIMQRYTRDSSKSVNDLMQQLTEMYAARSSAKMRY